MAVVPDGVDEPFDIIAFQISEEEDVIVDTASMALEDLNDPDADHTGFLAPAAPPGFGSVQLSGNGPEWDDYVGFDPWLNASLDRCSERDNTRRWNYTQNNLGLPAGADLRTLSEGLVWQWDSVPDSQDCCYNIVRYEAIDPSTGIKLHEVDEVFANQTGQEYVRMTPTEIDDRIAERLGQ